jgi:hypothetical protein
LFLPLLLAGCQGIAKAPAGMPRTELEVEIAIEPAFANRLLNADANLQQAIEEAVLAEADVGLRFYPVAARNYSDGQNRPAYRMTIRVHELVVDVRPPSSGSPARLQRLATTMSVAVEKRRVNAPMLVIAQSRNTGDGPTSPADKNVIEAAYQVSGVDVEGSMIERRMIVGAVQTAFRDSCRAMLPAIDREFAARPDQAAK